MGSGPAAGFVKEHFGPLWAVEEDRAFIHEPITAYVATKDGEIAGFAAYECTRRGYFGPTGVREDVRGNGPGAALLFRCLESMREMGYAVRHHRRGGSDGVLREDGGSIRYSGK